jgi:Fe-S cluster assembly protein SufD
MELKEKLLASYLAFENDININSDIHKIRSKALQNFEALGFPSKKLEAWKYTSLNAVLKQDYSLFPDKIKTLELKDIKKYFIHDIDSYKLIFIDGKFSSFLSETTHDNFDVCTLSSAFNKSKYKAVIEHYFNGVAKQDNMTSLNTAFANEGAFIHIPKHTEVEKPIQIINFCTGEQDALFIQPRNLIIAEENAHVQIIERHQSLTDNAILSNVVTEMYADKRANIDYYKIQNDNSNASLVDNTYIEQQTESICSVHTFSFGGNMTRNNLNFYQKGMHIDSILKGITIVEAKQHVDHHTLVHHIEPNCESHQDYKGIYDERSTGVFNGKVVVEKEAQKNKCLPTKQQCSCE